MPRGDRRHRARRTWGQRLLITANALALVAAVATAASLGYANKTVAGIDRISLGHELQTEDLEPGDPLNVLVVGIDDASGLAADDPARKRSAEDLAGQHTDSIMLMRLDPKAGTVQMLSFPRDLWVPIADAGIEQRINYALPSGGQGRLIRTITENFGIPIHHYLQVDFAGFGKLVEIIDGVPVLFPHPVRSRVPRTGEPATEMDIPTAGCWTLGPRQALALARDREGYQVQDADGEWHLDPGNDFTRVERQQLLVRLAVQRAFSKGARNPNTLRRLIDAGVQTVKVDDSLTPGDLLDIGIQFRSFNPAEIQSYQLPVTDGTGAGGAKILYLQEELAEPTLALFRGTPADASVAAGEITVQVRNGTGTQGQGAAVTDALEASGFDVVVPEDAEGQGLPTLVRYAAGYEAQARLVARHVAGPVTYAEASDLEDVEVELITGTDWVGTSATARPEDEVPGPTTTSTTTTTTEPGATAPTTPGTGSVPGEIVGDVDDPDEDAFYKPQVPPVGADCPPTP